MPRLRFPYRSLPGLRERQGRPALPIEIAAEGVLIPATLVGLVDTGAPYTLIPADLARMFGIRTRGWPRVGVAIAGFRGRVPLASGFTLHLRGPDLDEDGREATVRLETEALLVSHPGLRDFAILGQRGFLDRIEEFCVREQELLFEVRVERLEPRRSAPTGVEVRERRPGYGRGRRPR